MQYFVFFFHVAVDLIYWTLLKPYFENRIINFYEDASAAFMSMLSESFTKPQIN